MKLRIWVGLLWTLCLTACGPSSQEVEEIRLGVVTERASYEGERPLLILEQLIREANGNGGVELQGRRRPLKLFVEDADGSPEGATRAALRLINRHQVVALIGPSFSSNAIPVASVAEKARIPMISPGSTHPETTAGRPFAFRIVFTDLMQSQVLADFARRDLQADRLAVLFDIGDDYSRGIAAEVKAGFEARGGRVVAFEAFTTIDGDVAEPLRTIIAADPQVLFMPYRRVGIHAREFRRLGGSAVILGSDAWPETVLNEPALDGAFFSHNWHDDAVEHIPVAKQFMADYQRRYGQVPDSLVYNIYDTFGVLLEAIRRAGQDDPETIRNALAEIENFQAPSGLITYRGRDGDPPRPIFLVQLTGGGSKIHRVIQPN